jgi:hypothetical protein
VGAALYVVVVAFAVPALRAVSKADDVTQAGAPVP